VLYFGDWTLTDGERVVATSSDDEQIAACPRPNDEDVPAADRWLLFTRGEQVLVVGPGPTWSYRSAHEP
jgi:hypothetical protein